MSVLAAVCGLSGCTGSPVIRAAERGDQATLRADIARREGAFTLSNAEAASIARAVAERDARTAEGAQAVEWVLGARVCARELDDALAVRMRVHDDAGAQAALARIEAKGLDVDAARAFSGDRDAGWRAVGARALVGADDGSARKRALADPDPRVRRQAARAAREAADLGDLDSLAEAARVDPEPIVRSEAVRAIAALPCAPAERVASVLRDLWAAGDEGLREDIARAFASRAVYGRGGREALSVILERDHRVGAIEAAVAVLKRPDGGLRPDDEMARAATAQLARAIASGPRSARLVAIAQAPVDGDLRAAVAEAARDDDTDIRVAALGRLASSHDAEAVAELEALAAPGSTAALQARFALASAHDRRVQRWLEDDLASSDADRRVGAAVALAELGVAGRAAPLLTDESVAVRARAACTMIMAVRSE